MSSRNVYLDPRERAVAPQLHAVLAGVAADLASGRPIKELLTQGAARLENVGFRLDYLEARDSETLMPVERIGPEPARLLAAVHLGRVRLIDNVAIG